MAFMDKLFGKKNVNSDAKEKVKCKKCGAEILLTTARKYKGECAPCAHGRDIAEEKRKRDEIKIPSTTDLKFLPRWALVAFAVRCARRAEPALRTLSDSLSSDHIESIKETINLAERAASSAGSSVVNIELLAERIKVVIETTGDYQLATGPLSPTQFAKAAALVAEANLVLIDRPDVHYAAVSVPLAIALCGSIVQADSSQTLPRTLLSAVRFDF